jgi:hypothetical protein
MKYLFYTLLVLIIGAWQAEGQTKDSLHISNKNLSFTLHPVTGLYSIYDKKQKESGGLLLIKRLPLSN